VEQFQARVLRDGQPVGTQGRGHGAAQHSLGLLQDVTHTLVERLDCLGQIIVDGNFLAARTVFSGDFTGVFTYSPIGPVEPTAQHLEWEVIGTFRYDDESRLAGEWVQTDYRSFLTKLGVTATKSA
jgi:hypothetical protein